MFLSFLIPSGVNHTTLDISKQVCTCPEVTNLHKTSETSTSKSYGWNGSGSEYKVWYYRSEDSYTSSVSTAYSTSYTFSGLTAGHYTFYVQTVCGAEASGFIGVEDVVL